MFYGPQSLQVDTKLDKVIPHKIQIVELPCGSVVKNLFNLPMQETWVQSLIWEDIACHGATNPVRHNS